MVDSLHTLQTAEHGDGAGLGFRGIPFPATQASYYPGGLGEGAWVMWVLLLLRLALQCRQYTLQDLILLRVEHVAGLGSMLPITSQGQLQDAYRSLHRQTSQLRQPFRGFNLAGFNFQSLLLQGF